MSQLEKTWLWYNDMGVTLWAVDKAAFKEHMKVYLRRYPDRCRALAKVLGYKLEE